jgi:hypothetical protein
MAVDLQEVLLVQNLEYDNEHRPEGSHDSPNFHEISCSSRFLNLVVVFSQWADNPHGDRWRP